MSKEKRMAGSYEIEQSIVTRTACDITVDVGT